MSYLSSRRKQKPHIYDTRPSHNESSSSIKHQLKHSQSNQTFGQNLIPNDHIDSCIKFSNGWVFEGQHLNGKFHGWGMMISSERQAVYKGNFENGFFHNYGKILFHEMFSYLFSVQEIKKWIQVNTQSPKVSENNLKQIQVINPFQMKMRKKYASQFSKYKKTKQTAQYMTNSSVSSSCKMDYQVQWIKYEGEFLQGNATGFGTLKVIIINPEDKEQKQNFHVKEKTIKIMGKFFEGHIVSGIIKAQSS